MFLRMENEFEGIDMSRVRFTMTPNFRFDSSKGEVATGPNKEGRIIYPFATNSWAITEKRTLKNLVEDEVIAGVPAKKWAVFFRNDNGSVYWEKDGRKTVRVALFGNRALTWRLPKKKVGWLKRVFVRLFNN